MITACKEPATSTRSARGYRPRETHVANTELADRDLAIAALVTGRNSFVYAALAVGWAVEFLVSMNERIVRVFQPGQAVSHESKRIDALWHQVDAMKGLDDNWNGYGSEPPNAFARANAQEILLAAPAVIVPTRVAPSAQGGVGVCFVHGGRYADIEFLNSGEILAAASTGNGLPEVWEVKPIETREALKRIARFIHP